MALFVALASAASPSRSSAATTDAVSKRRQALIASRSQSQRRGRRPHREEEADRRAAWPNSKRRPSASVSICRPASSRQAWTMRKGQFLLIFVGIGAVQAGSSGSNRKARLSGRADSRSPSPSACQSGDLRAAARRIKKFIDALPEALDIIVRGVRAGPAGQRHAAHHRQRGEGAVSSPNSAASSSSRQLGISVPEALAKLALRVPATETNFFAIVIEIQSKAGGNLSEAVGNLSKTVRERKKMRARSARCRWRRWPRRRSSRRAVPRHRRALHDLPEIHEPSVHDQPRPHRRPSSVSELDGDWRGMMKKMINFDF